jgi:hypothetical protein
MTTLTPSLRSRLLEALEPFHRMWQALLMIDADESGEGPNDEYVIFHTLAENRSPKAAQLNLGDCRRLVALYDELRAADSDELKGGDASAHGNSASNETTPPLASEPAGANERIEHVRQLNLRRIEARQRIHSLGVMNTPLNADKRLASDALYALAHDALTEAEVAYATALRLLSPDEKAALASGVLDGDHRRSE